jgi:cyclophilin family peptidyl-prolyl cis-trans isomerase
MMKFLNALSIGIGLAGIASAQRVPAPAPPSNLRVTVLGVNAFLMEWKDNSDNEKGWEIRVSMGRTNTPNRFQLLKMPNSTSYVVITNDLPGRELSFQIAAFSGESGSEVFSSLSSAVTKKALDTTSFGAPTRLKAVAIDDGSCRLSWLDKASSEHGYNIQFKKGAAGKWEDLIYVNPGSRFNQVVEGLNPNSVYHFRTRAYRNPPLKFTAFSNGAKVKTKPFQAPQALVAKTQGEGQVVVSFKDKSSFESGFELEAKTGDGAFVKLGDLGANMTRTEPIGGFPVNTPYQFRVRAFRLVNNVRIYTAYSNVANVLTASLATPTEFTGTPLGETSLRLTWKDNSAQEAGFQIESRKKGETAFKSAGSVAAGVETLTLSGLIAGTTYELRVKAVASLSASSYAPLATVTTLDGITSDPHPEIFWNTSFVHAIAVSRPQTVTSVTVSGLPPGLSFNSTTRSISGTTTDEGVRTAAVRVVFSSGRVVSQSLVLRIIRPPSSPVISNSFPVMQVGVGASNSFALADKFADPDTLSAQRVTTTLGEFDMILYPLATPGTVRNFLTYANSGAYNDTFFHRSVRNFVVQGGGYKHTTAAGYKKVVAAAPIKNEPGISNLAGSVAMAKVGGNPDSATCEFFVNLSNSNASNLDFQNEGFSVFGRIAGTGMTLFNRIDDMPAGTYTLSVDGTNRALEDVPVNASSAASTLDPTQLVKITSIAPLLPLQYQATSSLPAIATVAVSNGNVVVTGVAAGTSRITVEATDLDGNKVSQFFDVTVAGNS